MGKVFDHTAVVKPVFLVGGFVHNDMNTFGFNKLAAGT